MFLILLFLLNTTGYARVAPIVARLYFTEQQCDLLVDINSADTYLFKTNSRPNTNTGYDSALAGSDFTDLKQSISSEFIEDVNDHYSKVEASIGQSTTRFVMHNDTVSFGLVKKFANDSSTESRLVGGRAGRIGFNPWQERKTNTTVYLYGEPRQLLYFVSWCYEDDGFCGSMWTINVCNFYNPSNDPLFVPVAKHPKNYWQISVDGYKYGKTISNRTFKAIFSSTTPDLHVPQAVFSQAVKNLNAKKEDNGVYSVDCSATSIAENITLNIVGTQFVINGSHYIFKEDGKCSLNLRTTNSNDWILGLPFYRSYGTCFAPRDKVIYFEKVEKHHGDRIMNGKKMEERNGVYTFRNSNKDTSF